jgi:hypothetical protein
MGEVQLRVERSSAPLLGAHVRFRSVGMLVGGADVLDEIFRVLERGVAVVVHACKGTLQSLGCHAVREEGLVRFAAEPASRMRAHPEPYGRMCASDVATDIRKAGGGVGGRRSIESR